MKNSFFSAFYFVLSHYHLVFHFLQIREGTRGVYKFIVAKLGLAFDLKWVACFLYTLPAVYIPNLVWQEADAGYLLQEVRW
ncbi:hypothetical protein Dimus_002372 [Dionaea muscipula]